MKFGTVVILLLSVPAMGNVKKCQQRGWSEEDCKRIAKHQVWVGMTAEMVNASLGRPKEIHPTEAGKRLVYKRVRMNSPMGSPLPVGTETIEVHLEGKDCDGHPTECKVTRIEN